MGAFDGADGRFNSQSGKQAGKRSGEVRRVRRLRTPAEVERDLGALETEADGIRWLRLITVWASSGLIPGTIANAGVRAAEVFLRHVHDQRGRVIEEQRTEIRRLRAKLARYES